jgi:hypothetical protein
VDRSTFVVENVKDFLVVLVFFPLVCFLFDLLGQSIKVNLMERDVLFCCLELLSAVKFAVKVSSTELGILVGKDSLTVFTQ